MNTETPEPQKKKSLLKRASNKVNKSLKKAKKKLGKSLSRRSSEPGDDAVLDRSYSVSVLRPSLSTTETVPRAQSYTLNASEDTGDRRPPARLTSDRRGLVSTASGAWTEADTVDSGDSPQVGYELSTTPSMSTSGAESPVSPRADSKDSEEGSTTPVGLTTHVDDGSVGGELESSGDDHDAFPVDTILEEEDATVDGVAELDAVVEDEEELAEAVAHENEKPVDVKVQVVATEPQVDDAVDSATFTNDDEATLSGNDARVVEEVSNDVEVGSDGEESSGAQRTGDVEESGDEDGDDIPSPFEQVGIQPLAIVAEESADEAAESEQEDEGPLSDAVSGTADEEHTAHAPADVDFVSDIPGAADANSQTENDDDDDVDVEIDAPKAGAEEEGPIADPVVVSEYEDWIPSDAAKVVDEHRGKDAAVAPGPNAVDTSGVTDDVAVKVSVNASNEVVVKICAQPGSFNGEDLTQIESVEIPTQAEDGVEEVAVGKQMDEEMFSVVVEETISTLEYEKASEPAVDIPPQEIQGEEEERKSCEDAHETGAVMNNAVTEGLSEEVEQTQEVPEVDEKIVALDDIELSFESETAPPEVVETECVNKEEQTQRIPEAEERIVAVDSAEVAIKPETTPHEVAETEYVAHEVAEVEDVKKEEQTQALPEAEERIVAADSTEVAIEPEAVMPNVAETEVTKEEKQNQSISEAEEKIASEDNVEISFEQVPPKVAETEYVRKEDQTQTIPEAAEKIVAVDNVEVAIEPKTAPSEVAETECVNEEEQTQALPEAEGKIVAVDSAEVAIEPEAVTLNVAETEALKEEEHKQSIPQADEKIEAEEKMAEDNVEISFEPASLEVAETEAAKEEEQTLTIEESEEMVVGVAIGDAAIEPETVALNVAETEDVKKEEQIQANPEAEEMVVAVENGATVSETVALNIAETEVVTKEEQVQALPEVEKIVAMHNVVNEPETVSPEIVETEVERKEVQLQSTPEAEEKIVAEDIAEISFEPETAPPEVAETENVKKDEMIEAIPEVEGIVAVNNLANESETGPCEVAEAGVEVEEEEIPAQQGEAVVDIYSEEVEVPPSSSDWRVTPAGVSLDDDGAVAVEDVQGSDVSNAASDFEDDVPTPDEYLSSEETTDIDMELEVIPEEEDASEMEGSSGGEDTQLVSNVDSGSDEHADEQADDLADDESDASLGVAMKEKKDRDFSLADIEEMKMKRNSLSQLESAASVTGARPATALRHSVDIGHFQRENGESSHPRRKWRWVRRVAGPAAMVTGAVLLGIAKLH